MRVCRHWCCGCRFSPSCRPHHGDAGLQELLASPEVDAVLVALPPQAQSAVIQAALRAGKHVLSEKPAAPTLEEAQQLLAFYRSLPQVRWGCSHCLHALPNRH